MAAIHRRLIQRMNNTRFGRCTRKAALPLLLYTALALLMTWPLAINFTTAVPGVGYDSWQNMWNMWWLKEALLHGHNPYFTTALYYPTGVSLLLQTLNPINFLISLPVHLAFGLVVAYNFVVLFSLAASGYTAYLLALDVTGDRRAALVGGAIFANSGYLLSQVLGGHTHMMAAEWLPLAVLALRRVVTRPGAKQIVLAGVLLAVNQLCDWQYFLFIVLWGAIYLLITVVHQRSLRLVRPLALALGLALVLVSPLAIATARHALEAPQPNPSDIHNFRIEQSADVADFLIPSQLHPLWGRLAEWLQSYKSQSHIQNKTAYLGVVSLVLAAIALRRRQGRFWLMSAVIFGVLALGPQLRFFGTITTIPLPTALLYRIPFVNISRYPIRFIVLTMLSLSMLAALGARQLFMNNTLTTGRLRSRSAILLTSLLSLIIVDNLTMAFPMVSVYIPPIYATLGQDPATYGVLEAPFFYSSNPFYLLYQTVHNKPMVDGYTSRPEHDRLLEQFPLVQELAYAHPVTDIFTRDPIEIAPSLFSYFNIRYLILHNDSGALRDQRLQRIAQAAAGNHRPLRQLSIIERSDERGASTLIRTMGIVHPKFLGPSLIYRVVPPATPLPFLGIGRGWSAPFAQPDETVARQLYGTGELLLYSAVPRLVSLELDVRSAHTGSLHLNIGNNALPPLTISATQQHLTVSLQVPSGVTSLMVHADRAILVTGVDLHLPAISATTP